GKVVAAVCHGPWLLVQADALKGCQVTSYKSIRKDVENAGATWVDEKVVVDNGIITSRNPDDLPAFVSKIIEEVQEGKHYRRATEPRHPVPASRASNRAATTLSLSRRGPLGALMTAPAARHHGPSTLYPALRNSAGRPTGPVR